MESKAAESQKVKGTNRILIVVTNAGEYEKVGYRTGLWLGELTHFWDVAEEAGFAIDIASPAGGYVPIDPESLMVQETAHMIGLETAVQKRYQDRAFMDQLRDSRKVSDVDPSDYDAIYLTGGHGVMFDFTAEGLARKVAEFFEAGKIVSAVCHGAGGLLNARLSTGEYLLKGHKATGFSWREEELARRADVVPFSLEEEMKKRGAKYEKAILPYATHVVEDGQLITGQNPKSARGVAEAVLKRLRTR
jgi:putative intracellular protease/amidase